MIKQYNLSPLDAQSQVKFGYTERFMIFQDNQVIKLSYPAHVVDPNPNSSSSGLQLITITAVVDDPPAISVVKCDKDGAVGKDDQSDVQIKSEIMVQTGGSGLSPSIASYLKIARPSGITGNFIIKVEYQRAVMGIEADETIYDGEQFSNLPYSPALMKNVLERLKVLENTTSIGSLFGTSLGTNDILDEDLTGVAPENYVRYERHEVNTASGISLVQPSKGSFYPNNLEVLVYKPETYTISGDDETTITKAIGNLFFYTDTESIITSAQHVTYQHRAVLTRVLINKLLANTTDNKITGGLVYLTGENAVTPLRYGTDYIVDSIDIPRTARTSSQNAVYQNLRFLTARNGEVLVSYQAFGGFASTEDIRSIHQDVTNTRKLITESGLVTTSTLDAQPFLRSMYKRLIRIEEFHNHNSQVEHRIGISSPGWHWLNVAVVYDKAWKTAAPVIHDIGTFRIQSTLRKWMYEFSVDVDMARPDASVIKVRTLGTNQDSVTDFEDYSKIVFRDNLAVRLCWVGNGQVSGLMLQVGWDFTPYMSYDYRIAQDTVLVTNKSGAASLWSLLTDPDQVNFPADGNISVYQHSKFVLTSDTTFQAGKKYWLMKDLYIYRRTSDTTIQEGKTYYEYNASAAQGAQYYPVDTSDDDYTPGTPTSKFLEDVVDGNGVKVGTQVNLFERIMYGRYPTEEYSVMTAAEATAGSITRYIPVGGTVTPNTYYEESANTYSSDTSFTMPNGDMWTYGSTGCKQCTKFIEPDGGIVAWLGNVNLTPFSYGEATCQKCDNREYSATPGASDYVNATYQKNPYVSDVMFCGYMQTMLDVASVSSVTLVLFDRLESKYVRVDGNVSTGSDGEVTADIVVNLEDLCFCKFALNKSTVLDGYAQEHVSKPSNSVSRKFGAINSSVTSLVKLSVEPFFGSLSRDTERFDLRQVRLHF